VPGSGSITIASMVLPPVHMARKLALHRTSQP
jgi:hypothetical protein